MLFMRAFIYVDKTSNKQIFGEKTTVNLEAQLSSFGHPDGCLSKEAFMEMIRDYKLHEAKRAEYKQPAMGPRNLLEKMNGDEDLWRNCAMHVKFCDMVEVQSNDEVIAPSPKAGSRFDFYTCRPDDIKTDNGISWILIVFNEVSQPARPPARPPAHDLALAPAHDLALAPLPPLTSDTPLPLPQPHQDKDIEFLKTAYRQYSMEK